MQQGAMDTGWGMGGNRAYLCEDGNCRHSAEQGRELKSGWINGRMDGWDVVWRQRKGKGRGREGIARWFALGVMPFRMIVVKLNVLMFVLWDDDGGDGGAVTKI